ncbi:MAG: glycosyltransferase family 2 protein [Myxococcota bacterium]
MVLCSVIIPSFNHARFIRHTVESVLSQQRPGLELEVLVMDGGSTDDTATILRPYLDRITFVSEKDRGQSHAINKGFARARGELVTWLCSDDCYEPDGLGMLLDAMQSDPDAVMVYGAVLQVDEDNRIFGLHPALRPPSTHELLKDYTYIQQAGSLLRGARLREVGFLDENLHYAMDLDLWLRMLKDHHGLALPGRAVARARYHAEAKTLAGAAAMADESMRVRWRHGAPLVGGATWEYARWRFVNLPLQPVRQRVRRLLRLTGSPSNFPP